MTPKESAPGWPAVIGLLLIAFVEAFVIFMLTASYKGLQIEHQKTLELYGRDLAYIECLEHTRPCTDEQVADIRAANEKALQEIAGKG